MLRHVSLFARWDFLVLSPLKMWRSDIRCYMVARVCPWMLGNAVRPGLFWDIYQSCWKGHSNLYEPKHFDAEHAIAIGYKMIYIYIVTLGFHSQFSCANVRSKLPQRGCFHWLNVPTSAWERVICLEASPSVDWHVPIPKHQIPDDSKWFQMSCVGCIAYKLCNDSPQNLSQTQEGLLLNPWDMPLPSQLLLQDTGETRIYLQPGLGVGLGWSRCEAKRWLVGLLGTVWWP